MAKVLGLGGLFFKSPDPEKLLAWYSQWLGIGDGKNSVEFRPQSMPANGFTVWSPFPANTDYFAPSDHHFMFNLIVDDLDGALGQVHTGGGQVIGAIEMRALLQATGSSQSDGASQRYDDLHVCLCLH